MARSLLGLTVIAPLAHTEIKRVLVINAHPDDSDFGASRTIAQLAKVGIQVTHVFAQMVTRVAKACGGIAERFKIVNVY
jgi:hypothetical protein